MDLGDLIFMGVLLASGVGSAIAAAAKKKNKLGGMTPKISSTQPPTLPDTGLPVKPPPRRTRPVAEATRPRTAPIPMPPTARRPDAPTVAVRGAGSKRRHPWRRYVVMREVLGPPKGMQ